jgi:trehalose 6-phosphate phosphatase
MKPGYLFDKNKQVLSPVYSKIAESKKIILFLDYDGTLVPMRKNPSKAILSASMTQLLETLIKNPNFVVVFVTGRQYKDIIKLLPFKNVTIASDHGFRITNKTKDWIHPKVKPLQPLIKNIYQILKIKLKPIKGVFVEDKAIMITIHYRNVKKYNVPSIKNNITAIVIPHKSKLKLTTGKKVFEIKPNINWNKGEAVLKIAKSLRYTTGYIIKIYIGDDATDEDAFRKLNKRGITIKVGKKPDTKANYFLNNISEVRKFLELLESTKKVRTLNERN